MNTLPARLDLEIYQGATWDDVLFVLTDAGTSALVGGCTAKLQVWSALDGSLLLDLSTANAKLVLNPSDGSIKIAASASLTAAVDAQPAVFDCFVTWPSGPTRAICAGASPIRKRVTV